MDERNIKSRIVNKHDIKANWDKATSFIPKNGEIIIYDADTTCPYARFKIGDGTTAVTVLPFADENKADLVHEHEDYALKNEATTTVTDDGEGNVVLTNIAVDEGSFTETDPTVPEWAKEPEKPNYTWNEITDKPFTDGKLNPECLPDDIGGGSENAVEYVEQTLTEEQKAQARANIGAAPAYTYGKTDLVDGVSELTPGMLYFVY